MLIHRLRHHHNKQRGDTIVEVLISITVISMILGGAYVTTNKSLIATRSAQERGNALKLAESQVEQLKGQIATNAAAVYAAASPFCIYNDFAVGTITIQPASDVKCKVGTNGVQSGVEPRFSLSITRSGNDFLVENSWFNVGGETTDKLQIRYRVYP